MTARRLRTDFLKRTGPIPGNLIQTIMAKLKVIPDTETFHWFNANPKGRRTGDCVIRAISAFLDFSWENTFKELAAIALKNATDMDCPETYERLLKMAGYVKQRMPRKSNGKKYTGREFCKEIAEPGTFYVLAMAGHLTFVGRDCRIYDIWDCGEKCVGNYWARRII